MVADAMFTPAELRKGINYGAVKGFVGGWSTTIVQPDAISPANPQPKDSLGVPPSQPRDIYQSLPTEIDLDGGRKLKIRVISHEETPTKNLQSRKPEDLETVPPHAVIDFEMCFPDKPPKMWHATLRNGEEYQGDGYKIIHREGPKPA